ncbi:hypothetical protein Tco_0196454 [Tanacetum coccineum]
MSSIRHNGKRQIKVPSKLVDSDYGTNVTKNRKKSKNKVLNDEVGGTDGFGKDLWDEVRNVTLTQDKCDEVCEEVENRGTEVNETNSDKEEDLVQPTPAKCNVSEVPMNTVNSSYARVLNKSLNNKLMLIPTEVGVDGIEVVIFDDEIVKEGSKKWELTGRFGLKQILPHGNGVFLFKFKSGNGINDVIESGIWMVNVTTHMCNMGNGRTGFARVLIEAEACKGLPAQIEIVYRNSDNMEMGRKSVKVEYDWKPPLCFFCSVFGHKDDKCSFRPKIVEEIEAANEELKKMNEAKRKEKGSK